jgi:hypothetical protein
LLSKRYPKPSLFYLTVYTSLEDVEIPEERDQGLTSEIGGSEDAPNEKNTATFTRSQDIKTIIISWEDGTSEQIDVGPIK